MEYAPINNRSTACSVASDWDLKAGLVDEVRLVVEPVLFGTGLALLKGVDDDYKLILSDVRKLNENSVQLPYQLKNEAPLRPAML